MAHSREDLENTLLAGYPTYNFMALWPHCVPLKDYETCPSLCLYNNNAVLKINSNIYEINMLHLAGDCAVNVTGIVMHQILHRNVVFGFLMPRLWELNRQVIAQRQKRQWADGMRNVVHRLHGKNIIHGDIKLSNFLYSDRDGTVLLCDFAGAALRTDPEGPLSYTTGRFSPWRARRGGVTEEYPLTVDDENYALALALYEMDTGRVPFDNINGSAIMQHIRDGGTIDVALIGDAYVKQMVVQLMQPMLSKTG